MAREPQIPLFLWITAAILAHMIWGGGADRASEVLEERAEVRSFVESVQRHVRRKLRPDLLLVDASELEWEAEAIPPPAEDETDPEANVPSKPDPLEKSAAEDTRDQRKIERPERAKERDKPEPAPADKPEEQKKKPEEKQPEPEVEKTKPKPPDVVFKQDRRVAVDQHVEDDNQKDNPNAEFISEHANHVQEQTQAQITATDQNSEKPTPGGQHFGPSDEVGDSHVTDVAHSEDRAGEVGRAPSEDQLAGQEVRESSSQPQGIPEAASAARSGPDRADPGQRGQEAQAALSERMASPATQASPNGPWRNAEEQEARAAQAGRQALKHRPSRSRGNPAKPLDFLGLGAEGVTERGVNLNLTPGSALAAIGQDQLARELKADGERRRSQHRGSWKPVGIERWRAAIENYVATVKRGNQTALATAKKPFARYLNRIHNRLHPIFADEYLRYLDTLPGSAGLKQNMDQIRTNLEIVLNQQNGSVVKMGVTRTSGVTVFDISALESVQRASPFGAPPRSIVSPDGNVYLHWEFHRNPIYACSTYFARPYIVEVPQRSAPPPEPSNQPFSPEEGSGKRGHLDTPKEPHRRSLAQAPSE